MCSAVVNSSSLEQLATEFFRQFARAEYCLKAAGFPEPGRTARAKWTALAPDVASFLEQPDTPELQAAVDYLIAHPPKKQVVVDGRLGWDAVLPTYRSRSELILLLAPRLSGEKQPVPRWKVQWTLVRARAQPRADPPPAGVILQACLNRHHALRQAYSGAAF